jgi:hypothetical protein
MPLVSGPTLTPKKLAANRANAQLSHGPVTAEGLIRVRDSNIKHGAYAQDMGEALQVLGEDPKDFEKLRESLHATWQPANELEERLVKRLARAIWRTERHDRLQESMAVRQVSEMTSHVDRLVEDVCSEYDQKVGHLEWLLESLAHHRFVTGAEDLDHFEAAYGQSPEGRPREILVCLNLLLDPAGYAADTGAEAGQDSEAEDETATASGEDADVDREGEAEAEPGDDPEAADESEADSEQADPLLLPDVQIATGPERLKARKRMKSLLMEEIKALQAARDGERESLLKTNAPCFRDSAIARSKPEAEVLLRREDATFRQIGRMTDLLLKLKREDWHRQNKKMNMQNEGESHDIVDNKAPSFLSHDVIDNKAT